MHVDVERRIGTEGKLPLEKRTIIHFMLVNTKINEKITYSLKPFDMSVQQFNILRILRGRNGKPANLSTLNKRMVTKMSNTTRLVDKLINKGFANRIVCPSNRRKVEINITEEGNLALKKMDQAMDNVEAELLQQFSKEELEQLNLLLHKF